MYDLVIKNAKICDGTGSAIYDGEVAVAGEHIAAVGLNLGQAKKVIDADGLTLSPGIIDNHTHYDAQITWDPTASPSLQNGVTTLLMGNCGFTIAPCRPDDRELILKNLTQVEGMSLDALLEGTHKGYESFGEYMNLVQSLGMLPNIGVYCGHSSIRNWVMGKDATGRTANDEEITQMKAVIRDALDHGAVGFATSTFQGHNGWGGIPMPSRFADEKEMRALVGTLGEAGRGCFMLTKGADTSISFLESLSADTGRPVVVAAIQYDHANPDKAFNDMRDIGAAVERGRRMIGQVACTPISFEFTLRGAYLFEALASWKPAIALYQDTEKFAALLSDPAFRNAVREELVSPLALNRFTDQWDKFEVLEVVNDAHKHLEHQSVAALAAADNKHPLDWLLDFGALENFDTMFNAQILNADEDQVVKLLKDPNSSIGLADAGAHLFLFCDADYGLHLISRYVRERGEFTLEEAMCELTSKQANAYGIKQRGTIKAGYFADLLLFDPDNVKRGPKQRLFDLPTGAARLVRNGSGLHGIWVNGHRVMNYEGVVTADVKPGHLLREFDS